VAAAKAAVAIRQVFALHRPQQAQDWQPTRHHVAVFAELRLDKHVVRQRRPLQRVVSPPHCAMLVIVGAIDVSDVAVDGTDTIATLTIGVVRDCYDLGGAVIPPNHNLVQ
jgi:hypothetical protein